MKAAATRRDRGGFALALVVLMLFAIAMAGVTGYHVVSSDSILARQNRDGQAALAVARAGLQRFLGEQIGQVGDSVSYAILTGIATITTQKVLQTDSLNCLYYIRSTGRVADARTPLVPAQRTVGTYAWQRMSPIPLKGALWVSGGTVTLGGSSGYAAYVSGFDNATTSECPGGGTAGVRGLVKGPEVGYIWSGSTLTGPAPTISSYSGYAAHYDTVGVRWDILSDASFPVDFDGSPPNWGSLPADSFPIVRYRGNLSPSSSWSGRGVLVVTGNLTIGGTSTFSWNGIVLAGAITNVGGSAYPTVRGMLIAGLNAANPNVTIRGDFRYHSCNAYKANRALSHLEVVNNTLFELNR